MNLDSYTIPKEILCSLLARLGPHRQLDLHDPLPDISHEQLTGMVRLLIHNQGGNTLSLNVEEQEIKNRLLAETRQQRTHVQY